MEDNFAVDPLAVFAAGKLNDGSSSGSSAATKKVLEKSLIFPDVSGISVSFVFQSVPKWIT